MSCVQRYLICLGIFAITMSDSDSSIDNEIPNALHVTAGNVSEKEDGNTLVDPNGYVLFCPCMGK